jgi:hypothetical protein
MPTRYYSAATRGFYSTDVSLLNAIPANSVVVSEANYQTLMMDQTRGKAIVPDANGNPVAVNAPTPPTS